MKKLLASLVLFLALIGLFSFGSAVAAPDRASKGERQEQMGEGWSWRGPTVNVGPYGDYDPATGDRTSPYPPYTRPDR